MSVAVDIQEATEMNTLMRRLGSIRKLSRAIKRESVLLIQDYFCHLPWPKGCSRGEPWQVLGLQGPHTWQGPGRQAQPSVGEDKDSLVTPLPG